jgi:hypothetical protein
MNYEKKYKEANDKIAARFGTNVAKEIFTDLYESDDERISNEIIKFLELPHPQFVGKRYQEDWIAWLEKQGVQKSNMYDIPKISIKDAVEVTSRMKYIPNDMKSIADFIIDYAQWDLQKSEWNQPTITVPLFRVLDALIQKGKPYCEGKSALEAITEVHNANEIEPKFKVGDWIINEDGDIAHIIDMHEDCYGMERYYIEFSDGIKTDPIACFVDEDFHLWSIKDAKDGDVLTVNGRPFIYCCNDDYEGNYCCIDSDGVFRTSLDFGFNGKTILPATKEQRVLLFHKIYEAGYEWDAERKELKRVEQNTEESACSEDERIRKALIKFHKSTIDIDGVKGSDIITWLEKQGKKGGEE